MPWHVTETAKCPASRPWGVIKDADGSVEGCHPTKADAEKQMAALYANEPGAKSMTRTARDRQPRDGTGWYRIANSGDGPAQILLYDLIGMWGITAKDFLRDLGAVNGPVDVHIASDGGDVFEAYAIYNALASRPGVTTVVDSIAASSASVIAMAGERRLMARTSQLMIHDAWAGIDGNAADLQHMVARLETVSGQIAGIYADTAGGTADHWRALMQAETWFTPEQALDAGLITGISGTGREPVPAGAGAGASAAALPGAIQAAAPADQAITAAGADESAWDASKAWAAGAAADDPAAFYNGICAGKKAGDPKTQGAHALPHHYRPGDPPNRHGVSAALGRLPGTDGLLNKQAAEEHLKSHQNAMGSGSQAASSSVAAPPSASRKETRMANDDGTLTIEGRRSRIAEIEGRCREVMASYPASVFPADVQTEWDRLVIESREHRQALEAVDQRNADLAQMYAAMPNAHDGQGHDGGQGSGRPQGGGTPRRPGGTPAFHPSRDIYDLVAIQQQARNRDELPGLYRDNAMRAIEQHRFPGSPSREAAQDAVVKLLDTVSDDKYGELPRRILATGSPAYTRVFGRALQAGNPGALGNEDSRILALGESPDTAGGYAVPFQLDPTLVLTSSGGVSPLRDISRVEKIVGKEYDLVTTGSVTAHRVAEAAPAVDDSPTLAQPTIRANRVQAFIPFSVELEGDWAALQAEMLKLLADAKALEEADAGGATTGFVLGTGTAPQAGGIITTLPVGQQVTSGTVATFALADIFKLKNSVGNRFRPRGQWCASSTIYDLCRQFGTSIANIWAESLQAGVPSKLIGYPVNEVSAMAVVTTTGAFPLLFGDFSNYLIVDRVGMNMELVPTLFGAAQGQFPTGRRGYFAWWRNNAVILNANAFRLLKIG